MAREARVAAAEVGIIKYAFQRALAVIAESGGLSPEPAARVYGRQSQAAADPRSGTLDRAGTERLRNDRLRPSTVEPMDLHRRPW